MPQRHEDRHREHDGVDREHRDGRHGDIRSGKSAIATSPLPKPTRPRTKFAKAMTTAAATHSAVTGRGLRHREALSERRGRAASPAANRHGVGRSPTIPTARGGTFGASARRRRAGRGQIGCGPNRLLADGRTTILKHAGALPASLPEPHSDGAAEHQAGFDRLQAAVGREDEVGGMIRASPRGPSGHVHLGAQLARPGIGLDTEPYRHHLDPIGARRDIVGPSPGGRLRRRIDIWYIPDASRSR